MKKGSAFSCYIRGHFQGRAATRQAMAGRLAASVMHELNNPSQASADLVYLIAKDADRPELVRAHAALAPLPIQRS